MEVPVALRNGGVARPEGFERTSPTIVIEGVVELVESLLAASPELERGTAFTPPRPDACAVGAPVAGRPQAQR